MNKIFSSATLLLLGSVTSWAEPWVNWVDGTDVTQGSATTLSANAEDNEGYFLQEIAFYVSGPGLPSGWNPVDSVSVWDTYVTVSINWTPPSTGTYYVTAEAYNENSDASWGNPEDTFSVAAANVAPVTISVSADTITFGGSTTLTGSASDDNGNLSSIQFYVNKEPEYPGWNHIGGASVSGFSDSASISWTPPYAGCYAIHIRAFDTNGEPDSNGNVTGSFCADLPPPPTVSIGASPDSGFQTLSSTISWSSSGATSVSVSGPSLSSAAASGSQAVSLDAGCHTYTITASNAGGTSSDSVTVSVGPAVSIGATATSGYAPLSSTISWSSSGSGSFSISGPGLSSSASSGSYSDTFSAGTYTYSISGTACGQTASDSVTIVVSDPPATASISASTQSGYCPLSTTISWSTSNATSASISGPGLASTALSGSQAISGLSVGAHVYTISASGPGGSGSDSVTVNVLADPSDRPTGGTTIVSGSSTMNEGQSVTLRHSAADGCDLESLIWRQLRPDLVEEQWGILNASAGQTTITKDITIQLNQVGVYDVWGHATDSTAGDWNGDPLAQGWFTWNTPDITVINVAPKLTAIADVLVEASSGQHTVPLSGISQGGGQGQSITITAVSSNPDVIPHPVVTYTSPEATGSLTFTAPAPQSPAVQITVTVKDNGGVANGGADTTVDQFEIKLAADPVVTATPSKTSVQTGEVFSVSATITDSNADLQSASVLWLGQTVHTEALSGGSASIGPVSLTAPSTAGSYDLVVQASDQRYTGGGIGSAGLGEHRVTIQVASPGGGGSTDSDADGMPDSWETTNQLDPYFSEDGSWDFDGDGLSNLREYQTARNPVVAESDSIVLESTDLGLWLRSDSGITQDAGGNVSEWQDRSGHARHAAQATSTARPVPILNVVNGQSAVRFDGIDDSLAVDLSWMAGSEYTIFTVAGRSSSKEGNYILGSTGSTINGVLYFGYLGDTLEGTSIFTLDQEGNALDAEIDGYAAPPTYTLHVGRYSGSDGHALYGNGHLLAENSNTVGLSSVVGGLIGGGSVDRFEGDVIEVIIYKTGLTNAQREGIEAYLKTRYGVSQIDSDADGLGDDLERELGSNPNSADSDADGMPDGWELKHGLELLNASDATADSDGDGLTNLQEYQQGTDPNKKDDPSVNLELLTPSDN